MTIPSTPTYPLTLSTPSKTHKYILRPALESDIPALNNLITLSTSHHHTTSYYPPSILASAQKHIYPTDIQQIQDGTSFLIEAFPLSSSPDQDQEGKGEIVGVAAWSYRGRGVPIPEASSEKKTEEKNVEKEKEAPPRSDPEKDPATLRAMYTHPHHARLSLGRLLLQHAEDDARENGYKRMEFGATYHGVGFYERCGYVEMDLRSLSTRKGGVDGEGEGERKGLLKFSMPDGQVLELIKMGKDL